MNRPSVTLACGADRYSNRRRERTIEFFDQPSRQGGLINFYRLDDGRLSVAVYCTDPGVVTITPRGPTFQAERGA